MLDPETCFKNDCVISKQRIFRRFNIGRLAKVKNWPQKLRTTASAPNTKPGGFFRAVLSPENSEGMRVAIGRSPRTSRCRNLLPSALTTGTPLLTYNTYKTRTVQPVKPWFCLKKCILSATLYLNERTSKC